MSIGGIIDGIVPGSIMSDVCQYNAKSGKQPNARMMPS